MRSTTRFTLLSLVLVLAFSATAVLAAPTPPAWVDISLHDESAGTILLVSGELPETVKLPAELELAMPKGSELQWAGEILGGDGSADPEAKYKVRTQGDHDVYTLTMTKARTGQIEALYPQGVIKSATGAKASLTWTPSQPVPAVRVAIRIPQGAKITTPAEGAQIAPVQGAYTFYYREYADVKAGEPIAFAFAYERGAAAGAAGTTQSGSVVPIILVIVGILAALAVGIAVRNKMRLRDGAAIDPGAPTVVESSGSDETPEAFGTPTDDETAEIPSSASAGKRRALIVAGGLVAVFVVAMVVSANTSQSARAYGDEIVREFAQGDACTSAQIQLVLPKGDELEAETQKVFTALEGSQVIKATLNTKTQVLKVDFCDSTTNEDAIKAVIQPLGVLAQ